MSRKFPRRFGVNVQAICDVSTSGASSTVTSSFGEAISRGSERPMRKRNAAAAGLVIFTVKVAGRSLETRMRLGNSTAMASSRAKERPASSRMTTSKALISATETPRALGYTAPSTENGSAMIANHSSRRELGTIIQRLLIVRVLPRLSGA